MDNNDKGRILSHGKVQGYLRRDGFGRTFIDRCPDDETHLTHKTDPGVERPGCRKYLDDLLVPEESLGQNVTIVYDLRIIPKTEN